MMDTLLEPFQYTYMSRAIWVSALVGGSCGFLSCFLILKRWSLMGDALSHAIVPGVAIAYLLGLPYAFAAFTSALVAGLGMVAVRRITQLREDVIIGFVFTTMFALGLVIVSINPTAVNVQSIILGNILAITDEDILQVILTVVFAFSILLIKWRDLFLSFFDEAHSRTVGIDPWRLRILFFLLLSACAVAALQTVGAVLVIATLVTPGVTAYLLTSRFNRMIVLAVTLGAGSSAIGAYLSYFLEGTPGGVIVLFQTFLFILAFLFSPKHGRLSSFRSERAL
ncbi:MAG: metal ABC transporter permease [Hyphomicrobium sp.]